MLKARYFSWQNRARRRFRGGGPTRELYSGGEVLLSCPLNLALELARELARETDMTGTTQPNTTAPPPAIVTIEQPQSAFAVQNSTPSQAPHLFPPCKTRLSDDPRIPAWLVSTIFHTLLLLLLALLTTSQSDRRGHVLSVRQVEPTASVALEIAAEPQREPRQTDSQTELPITTTIAPQQASLVRLQPLNLSDTRWQAETEWTKTLAGDSSASQSFLSPMPSGGGLSGRTPKRRRELGQKYGATRESEEAVELALKWLAAHQRPGGGWSFDLSLHPCNGQCQNSKISGDTPTPSTAATGLAMLAFLGAGYTHESGPYAKNIHDAIYFLRDAYGETESGYDWQQGSMYGHGIALMALAEALAMTTEDQEYDQLLKQLVEMGTFFTVVAQHPRGSWGYVPGSPGDTTLTGWQVLSLIAARRNHIPLRTDTLSNAKSFLFTVQGPKPYSFGYRGPEAEPTTTAIGLTLMLYLGESPHKVGMHVALNDLVERGPAMTNIYHDYYATLALHHARHYGWNQWNRELRDHLVASQAKQGHEAGSWHFDNEWSDIGGRLYTTAMCAMTLEIYYRYLPLYESVDEFPL